jgi:O-succinylbenzoic acid--CoA ligase
MLESWVAARPPDAVFLTSPQGILTYGDLAAAARGTQRGGQITVRPDASLDSVVDLMTLPGNGRQVVVMDPGLPVDEATRRSDSAAKALGRNAVTILFTSGTMGPAKAVRLTAANWAAAVEASAAHLGHGPDDVWLASMPLHHVGGIAVLYRTAYVGASVRWLPVFDAGEFSRALRSGVTLASVVPTMLRRVLDDDDHSYGGLRAVLVGGGPIPTGLLEEAQARGIPALPTYGMTETCAQVATLRPGSELKYAADPLPGVEVRIGDGGLIQVRGPQVSPGYADADDRPADEWFTTPDLGEVDGEGALRVLGRADDVIVTGGENVNPARVEAVLASHPGVEEVVVVGVSDDTWGQRVAAAYRGSVLVEELLDWARSRLARAEVPHVMQKLDALPTGSLGKPDRRAAREMLS